MFDSNGKPVNLSLVAQSRPETPSTIASPPHALLATADPDVILDELTPVLALVGAVGMNQQDREEWLVAAVDALKDIPADLLKDALRECRRKVDHPSKVIPFVVAHTSDRTASRRRMAEWSAPPAKPALVAPGQSICTGEEATEIINRLYPQARDGAAAPVHVDRGPPRKPTRSDYLALGVEPETLDRMGI